MATYLRPELADELLIRFTYTAPRADQPERYQRIRSAALDLALLIADLAPPSRERDHALDRLDEVVMHANAAIARRESPDALDSLLDD